MSRKVNFLLIMMINIQFKSFLKEKFGENKTLKIDTEAENIDIKEFLRLIEKEEWGSELIEDGHVRNPVMMIIDDNLVQYEIEMKINEKSNVSFYVMFAGG